VSKYIRESKASRVLFLLLLTFLLAWWWGKLGVDKPAPSSRGESSTHKNRVRWMFASLHGEKPRSAPCRALIPDGPLRLIVADVAEAGWVGCLD